MKHIKLFEEFINEGNHWNFKVGDTVTVQVGNKAVKAKIIKIDLDKDSALVDTKPNSLTFPLSEIYPKHYNLTAIKQYIEQTNSW
jgi:hypothetical protein